MFCDKLYFICLSENMFISLIKASWKFCLQIYKYVSSLTYSKREFNWNKQTQLQRINMFWKSQDAFLKKYK